MLMLIPAIYINPFLLNLLWPWCSFTAIELLTKTNYKNYKYPFNFGPLFLDLF